MQPITRINANDPVIFSDMNLRFNEIEARDNEQQEQINVLSEKTPINLNPGSGYTISYQASYIQNNNIYIDVIIKKTDDTAFTTGNLYVAYSNLLSANSTYPINAVPFSTPSGSNVVNDNLLALITASNVTVKIERTDIRCIRITGLIPRR